MKGSRKERKDARGGGKKGDNKGEKKGKKGVQVKQASTADKYALFNDAVVVPRLNGVVSLLCNIFQSTRGRAPKVLKEDSCGTAYLSREWVKSNEEHIAVGVESDKSFLQWGRQYNPTVIAETASRLTLTEDPQATTSKADVVTCFNYNCCAFKQRLKLIQYFQKVAQSLEKDGLFICDIFGGAEAVGPCMRTSNCGTYKYSWEQEWYNPLTHELRCHVNFGFEDGSSLKRAYSYDWRLWSIPEIRECMQQAGFSTVKVWWKNDKNSGGDSQATKGLQKLSIKDEEKESEEDEQESKSEDSEEESDNEAPEYGDISGDEMEEYKEVETVKQTKRWTAYLVGML